MSTAAATNLVLRDVRAFDRAPRRDLLANLLLVAAFVAVAVPVAVLVPSFGHPSAGVAGSLVIAYALASRVRLELGSATVSPAQLVLVPMLFVLPLGWVPLAVAAGALLAVSTEPRGHVGGFARRTAAGIANAIPVLGAVLVMAVLLEPPLVPSLAHWPVYGLALAAQFAFDHVRSSIRPLIVLRVPPLAAMRRLARAHVVDAALAPIGFAVASVCSSNPIGVVLVVPLVALLAYVAQERQARVEQALEVGHAYRDTALLLGESGDLGGSTDRDVVSLVLRVADLLDLDPRRRQHAELVALLHDVGKASIPPEIINKPGSLTPEERAIVETHTVVGGEMLAELGGFLAEVGPLVRSCRERWDGSGYPDGLAGDRIPLVSRIVCCCDAYCVMITDRPYRSARTPAEALEELRRCSGKQFDPIVVQAVALVVGDSDVLRVAA